ncbi:hypothetical protein BD309DRAFT_667856 [Dichomitus squalens]|nr:hypothetical protein BD309DRAFT_667856 [Dichomitus squalens]
MSHFCLSLTINVVLGEGPGRTRPHQLTCLQRCHPCEATVTYIRRSPVWISAGTRGIPKVGNLVFVSVHRKEAPGWESISTVHKRKHLVRSLREDCLYCHLC